MNQKLTEQIAYHILANLGILPSNFVNQEQTKTVIDKKFLLPEKITFETEDGSILNRNVYGCQISVTNSKEFKMLLADCSQDKYMPEYCLVIQLKNSPAFGIYLISDKLMNSETLIDSEALIAVNTDKTHWIPCTTYLQATFLAGMEQLRDLGFGWTKCVSYQELHSQLLSFIKFHSNFFEVSDEG